MSSPQTKFVEDWNQAFKNFDLDFIQKSLHKDYLRYTYPRSLGKPEQTKEQWFEELRGYAGYSAGHESTIHSIIDTPGKVIIHITTTAKTTIGVDVIRESILIIHIVTDEDGSLKIKQVDEFTDSKSFLDFQEKFPAPKVN